MVVEFERYWAEAIRTFKAEPARLVPARHEDFNKLCEQIMYMMKPGKTLSQFYREAADNLRKSGTGYMHEYGLGQGIGMSMHELPVIDEDDNTQLKEGMCLTLRLAMKDRKLGATMTGNTLCLTKDGPEILTEYL
jgi:Xaa-Pro dipeptidase